jgi:hypothetical protein
MYGGNSSSSMESNLSAFYFPPTRGRVCSCGVGHSCVCGAAPRSPTANCIGVEVVSGPAATTRSLASMRAPRACRQRAFQEPNVLGVRACLCPSGFTPNRQKTRWVNRGLWPVVAVTLEFIANSSMASTIGESQSDPHSVDVVERRYSRMSRCARSTAHPLGACAPLLVEVGLPAWSNLCPKAPRTSRTAPEAACGLQHLLRVLAALLCFAFDCTPAHDDPARFPEPPSVLQRDFHEFVLSLALVVPGRGK